MGINRKFDLQRIVLYFLVIAMVIYSCTRYIGVEWVKEKDINVMSMSGNTSIFWELFIFGIFVLLSVLVLSKIRFKFNALSISSLFLFFAGIFWCIYDIDIGIGLFYYSSTALLLIEISLLLIVMQIAELRDVMRSLVCPLAIIYTVLTVYETILFASEFKLLRMANGKVIEYFATALFLTAIWNCVEREVKWQRIVRFLCCLLLLVCSVYITSRGWLIQSVLLLLGCYISNSKQSLVSKIKRITICVVLCLIIYLILNRFMNEAVELVFSRFNEDTRISQYIDFFEQNSIWQLIVGQGYYANYDTSISNQYSYIDNQILFWAFRYGILSVLGYWLPFIYAVFYKVKVNKKYFTYIWLILMWFLAMMGLSVYYGIGLNIGNIFVIYAVIDLLYKKGYVGGEKTCHYTQV